MIALVPLQVALLAANTLMYFKRFGLTHDFSYVFIALHLGSGVDLLVHGNGTGDGRWESANGSQESGKVFFNHFRQLLINSVSLKFIYADNKRKEHVSLLSFHFQAGDLNFHSSSYVWLVVNQGGTNAQFMGSGTVNDGLAPNGTLYKFMLWAGDGSPDTFRIKIWWEDNAGEYVVYDNGFDQAIGE